MDGYEARKREWEDLNVTREELRNITECLKKEEFRNLLIEYAEEVNDPENRKIYEQEITQLERERGVDVTFVHPEPGYVIKTSINGEKKCFINISKSDIVARPSSQPSYEEGNRGLHWSIPYTLIPPRDDLDKKNVRCVVFDVVFHPDTIYLASKNTRFRDIVNQTAMDGVESNFKVKLDRKNLKFPKMNFKGIAHPSVLRKPSEEGPKEELNMDPEIYQKLMSSYDNSRVKHSNVNEEKPQRPQPKSVYYKEKNNKIEDENSKYSTPKFKIKYQTDVDMIDYVEHKDSKMFAAIPKKLVITIDLPLLAKATDSTLDIQDRFLTLKSEHPAKYLLELPLPYSVDGDNGNAKFDQKYKKLTVTLPVIRTTVSHDSGVDSDNNSPLSPTSDGTAVTCSALSDLVLEETTVNHNSSNALETNKNLENLENSDEINSDALRTSPIPFMNPTLKYSLPSFTCNMYDSQLAFIINVKNVDPESIQHKMLDNNVGIHVLFTSVGTGFFPQHYSLCIKLEETSIEPESVVIEPWDNNVVFTIKLKDTSTLSHYLMGLNDEFMEEKDLPTSLCFNKKLKELAETDEEASNALKAINVRPEKDGVVIDIHSNQLDSDDEQEEHEEQKLKTRPLIGEASKSRSISESSGDELPSSSGSTGLSKGILKSQRNRDFSRSVSESSADENGLVVSSTDFSWNSVHEAHSESECCSLKKTVRFNNVVSRKLFRMNSSILGQRKKNQRKLRNKKRAQERRLSESENSETEERDKYKISPETKCDQEVSENVKSILNYSKQKSANIKIELKNGGNQMAEKRKGSTEEENPEDVTKSTRKASNLQAEFKNDLIFDLDM